ncbi:MAG: DUF4838 domain-containing protein [Lentisphaerae bacterium]|nr:DUF4838 domain-containing protein [Lentisphaerota bacterium]
MKKLCQKWLVLAVLGMACSFALNAADEFVVVENHQAKCSIVVPENTARYTKWAKALAKYIKASSKAELAVQSGSADGAVIKLQIDPAKHSDIEEFSFTFPDQNTIVISGGCENGLKYGVFRFLENYVGLRRLFPGKLGDHIPENATIKVPRKELKCRPKYLSRYLGTGAYKNNPEFYDWSRSLGANNPRIWIRHYLAELLPVEKYGQTMPEIYPIHNGKRVLPAPKQHTFWQPCFTEPKVVDALAENVIAELSDNKRKYPNMEVNDNDPRLKTIALGINDAGGFCECERCLKTVPEKRNMIGSKDYSSSYIKMINQVADKVTATHRDCKLPFLAYHSVLNPPADGVKLNPALVPAIAFDSMYTADPERRKEYRELVQKWNAALPELGVWDYIWGGAYLVPRTFNNMMTEHLRWNYAHGIKHYYSEFSPGKDWTEGPKAYLIIKVLWDPDVDKDAILDDWFNCAVGQEAAPYYKKYFENMEKFWTQDVLSTSWFKARRGYSSYGSSGYLEALPLELLAENEKLLDEMVAKAGTPLQKERANYFRKLFLDRKDRILAFKNNIEVKKNAAKFDFSKLLYSANFDPTPKNLSTWQRAGRKAKFFRTETGGVDHSAALGIDADGSARGGACYEASIKVTDKRKFKVVVDMRADGVENSAKIYLSVQWRNMKGKMLSSAYRVDDPLPQPYDNFWRTLTVYTETPPLDEPLKLCVDTGISNSLRGKVYVDNIRIYTTSDVIKDVDKYTVKLLNHNFDKKPLRWASWQPKGHQIKFVNMPGAGRENSAAMVADFSNDKFAKGSRGNLIQNVNVKNVSKVLVTAWVKISDKAGSNAYAGLELAFRDAAGKKIAAPKAQAEHPAVRDGNWQKLQFTADVPANAEKMQMAISVRYAASGMIAFDDITVLGMPR